MTTVTDVRIVEATKEHIPFIAWVVNAATRSHMPRGMWDFVFDDDEAAIQRYLEVFAETEQLHWGHYSIFLVAEVDGTPAAALCGFFENEFGVASMIAGGREADQKIGRTPEQFAAGWERAKSIANIGRPHEPGAWVLEHVACKPEFRRRGLVEQLISAMLQRGRDRGAKTADIGVFIGNDPAQRLYEKCGFEVVDEARNAEFEAAYGSPGAFYLRRAV
jgi:translation initiation factor 4G